MNSELQNTLLFLYGLVLKTGFLSTKLGRSVFEFAYCVYKEKFEAYNIGYLQKFIQPNSVVVDVGANIGFFTLHFANWVKGSGYVLAIEPEKVNYNSLNVKIKKFKMTDFVETIQAVLTDKPGPAFIKVNPLHPGDHRIADKGCPVSGLTLDGILKERNWPHVSLIKIDVQGTEARVLRGACEAIQRYYPAIYVEVDENRLLSYGDSIKTLLSPFIQMDYSMHIFNKKCISEPLTYNDVKRKVEDSGYTDLLILHNMNKYRCYL
jgi:FkbM family methyltransferase